MGSKALDKAIKLVVAELRELARQLQAGEVIWRSYEHETPRNFTSSLYPQEGIVAVENDGTHRLEVIWTNPSETSYDVKFLKPEEAGAREEEE